MSEPRNASYWVLKVLGIDSLVLRQEYARLVRTGDLCVVSGELCEPVVELDSEEAAKARAIVEHQKTDKVHRVMLTINLDA